MKPVQKLFRAVLFFVCSAVFFSGCAKSPSEKALEEIRARKILRVAVKLGMPGFCEKNAVDEYAGLEIDLGRLLATAIIGPAGEAEFVVINAQTRSIFLDSGEVDLAIANFTITEERKRRFNFSAAYYVDSVGFMVKKDSGIKSLQDLTDKRIGVVRGSTTADSIHAAFPEMTTSISLFAYFADIKAALDAGEIDAFSVDIPILRGFLEDTVELLPDSIAPQPYGVATRLFQTELAKEVNNHIEKWLADGTIEKLIAQHNL